MCCCASSLQKWSSAWMKPIWWLCFRSRRDRLSQRHSLFCHHSSILPGRSQGGRPSWSPPPRCYKHPMGAGLPPRQRWVSIESEPLAEDSPRWKGFFVWKQCSGDDLRVVRAGQIPQLGVCALPAMSMWLTCCDKSWNWDWRGSTGQCGCPTRWRGGHQGSRAVLASLDPPQPWWEDPAQSSSWLKCLCSCWTFPPPPVGK